ncbi:hypothetical protein SAMD00019534_090740 [Acytostelium subglobosum LB1]|uniref:hypothetical protein n=1 Tax=Acytostelium subglobosum LB1 TaxID=1410327 RepID=UPI000644EABA|nr:hypothetical protein SAMD00019534_090740 [Acytostelium subglobosum LB1]GAM25899.1 hypothetical protein SAMD00019534_090740 [Acytostelium subglobosum LB1]|eukprot:XP_012750942.1 hypothetical protein SAMD00019534_090740 [Acytostelium subglobosum LB1]
MARTRQQPKRRPTSESKFKRHPISAISYSSHLNLIAYSIGSSIYAYNLTTKTVQYVGDHQDVQSLTFSNKPDSKYFVTTSPKKTFKIWTLNTTDNSITCTQTVNTNKKIFTAIVTNDDKSIVLSNRDGDVYLYHIDGSNNITEGVEEGDEQNLLLGHFSAITDIHFSQCFNYLITSDRDEKIRVSNYPNTFDIQNFCLGHKTPDILVSGSGDGTINVWRWKEGTLLQTVDVKGSDTDSKEDFVTIPLAFANNTLFVSIEERPIIITYRFDETETLVESKRVDLPFSPLFMSFVVSGDKLVMPVITNQADSPLLCTLDITSFNVDTGFSDPVNGFDYQAAAAAVAAAAAATSSSDNNNNNNNNKGKEDGEGDLANLNNLLKIHYKKYLTLNTNKKRFGGNKADNDVDGDEDDDAQDDDQQDDDQQEGDDDQENTESAAGDNGNNKPLKLRKMTVEGAKEVTK